MNIELLKLMVVATTSDITTVEQHVKTMDRKTILHCLVQVNELRIAAAVERIKPGYEVQIDKYILALQTVEQVIMFVITGLLVADDELF